MDINKHSAPIQGSHATPTKPHLSLSVHKAEEAARFRIVPDPAYQNAHAQKAFPARTLDVLPMHIAPPRSTAAPLSVVLNPSPIKVHDYSEYDVALQDATTPTGDDGPPRKKRGRPKGWRANVAYGAARVDLDSSSVMGGSRAGRQRHMPNYSLKRRRKTVARPDSPPPREVYLALRPTYTHFLCEWSSCKADLHNLDTLRRHVSAVHLKSQQHGRCFWGKCADKSAAQHVDGATLAKHLEQEHLVPMAWHIGDGPENSWDWSIRLVAAKDTIPDFLKDREGNQVTPSTRDQEVEDLFTFRNNRRKLKELIMRRDENLESQSSDGSEDEGMGSGL
ncbi:hypothetical protein ISF_02719 [Cordyceps fumosorosea ARSEF 2679]|uniref:C2H2-type domain-containing protein n=1 Tax=Cordyceps fumosorosea (strain ARSEF 2679) TaxID=1081104 RepID=A0A162MS94_CORFA|nr:hypothetical protein ISF_02719 [Cordyceps fumosorosea ARSEF 2679]OAA69449.1 hypothetical protein ISF_02719 [Cordyceps fumosorosea ARSEF 2679]